MVVLFGSSTEGFESVMCFSEVMVFHGEGKFEQIMVMMGWSEMLKGV